VPSFTFSGSNIVPWMTLITRTGASRAVDLWAFRGEVTR
jgi:hypothetical protein